MNIKTDIMVYLGLAASFVAIVFGVAALVALLPFPLRDKRQTPPDYRIIGVVEANGKVSMMIDTKGYPPGTILYYTPGVARGSGEFEFVKP